MGSCNVGKTSIINKYVKGVFYEKPSPTVGIDFANKLVTKEQLKSRSASTCDDNRRADDPIVETPQGVLMTGEEVILQIWDTTGQETFKSMNKMFFRGVHGVVLVCDISDPESFT